MATATPSTGAEVVVPIQENLTGPQAAWAKRRLVGLPGVVFVSYHRMRGRLFVYVDPSITRKQRSSILLTLGHATAH